MNDPQPSPKDFPPPDLESVGVYADLSKAHEHGLVILAMGLDYWISENADDDDDAVALLVPKNRAEQVSNEIREYVAEQADWEKQKEDAETIPYYQAGVTLPFFYVVLLLIGFWFQLRFHPVITEYGANVATLVVGEHEWWRPLTALFLHADWMHLASNATIGILFGVPVAMVIGPIRGWGLILASGFLGNFATSLMRPFDPAHSIGASTAVFGALGILTASGVTTAFRMRRFFHYKLIGKLAPLGAGLTLLAFQGIGDGDTDVLAHFSGFGVGFFLGFLVGIFRNQKGLP